MIHVQQIFRPGTFAVAGLSLALLILPLVNCFSDEPAIYVAGIYSDGGNAKACYWVDGARTDLSDIPGHATGSIAYGIAVAE